MTIHFSVIPNHIQVAIAQKQNFRDFAKFSQSSGQCHKVSLQCRTTRSLEVKKTAHFKPDKLNTCNFWISTHTGMLKSQLSRTSIPVLFKKVFVSLLTEKSTTWLTNFILSTNSEIECLIVDRITMWDCLPELRCSWLNGLLQAAKVAHFQCYHRMRLAYFSLPAIKNLKTLEVAHKQLPDEDFLGLRSTTLSLGRVADSGINTFLKEWQNGDRIIEKAQFLLTRESSINDILNGLSYEISSFAVFQLEYVLHTHDDKKDSINLTYKFDRMEIQHLCNALE